MTISLSHSLRVHVLGSNFRWEEERYLVYDVPEITKISRELGLEHRSELEP